MIGRPMGGIVRDDMSKRAKRLGKPTLRGSARERVHLVVVKLHAELFGGNATHMAQVFRVSQPTVSQWVSGTSAPTLEHLQRLAKLAHMRFEDLVAENGDEADPYVDLQTAVLYGQPGTGLPWPPRAVNGARQLLDEGERHTPQQWTKVLKRLSGG